MVTFFLPHLLRPLFFRGTVGGVELWVEVVETTVEEFGELPLNKLTKFVVAGVTLTLTLKFWG